jgi:hypothetical protein
MTSWAARKTGSERIPALRLRTSAPNPNWRRAISIHRADVRGRISFRSNTGDKGGSSQPLLRRGGMVQQKRKAAEKSRKFSCASEPVVKEGWNVKRKRRQLLLLALISRKVKQTQMNGFPDMPWRRTTWTGRRETGTGENCVLNWLQKSGTVSCSRSGCSGDGSFGSLRTWEVSGSVFAPGVYTFEFRFFG